MPDSTHTANGVQIYKRLLGYAVPYWKAFIIAVVAMAGFSATNAGFAKFMEPLVDEGFVDRNIEWISWAWAILVGIFVARAITNFFAEYSVNWLARRVIKDIRKAMFEHMVRMPTFYYDNSSSGELISKYTFDVEQVSSATTTVIAILFKETFTFLFLIGLMLHTSWQLTLIFIAVGPIVVWLVAMITDRFRTISKRIQKSMGLITHVTEEVIEGHRVVKIFDGHQYEEGNFEKVNEYNRQQRMKLEVTRALSDGVIQLIIAMAFAAIIYISTNNIMGIDVTAGQFSLMMMSLMLLQQPIKKLTTVNAQLQKGIAAAEKIFEMVDTPREADSGNHSLKHADGDIVFDAVTFSYEAGKGNVLEDISFKAERGKTIALVGRSGSGKSTLVSLLARFYDIEQGSIQVDGNDIRDIKLEELRRNIALVTQHVTLFNDSIGNNIAYGGLAGASEEQIRKAADLAHVTEFVEKMPEGFDTLVGENGVKLSGGQRQRLAIARALLKDAPILILDEATSALDTESERHIQAALEQLISNRTTFVIAHRLSTIENADTIIVMHEGRIVEQGSHSELLAQDGHYANLYKMQFKDAAE